MVEEVRSTVVTEEEIIPTQEVAVAQKSTLTPSKVDENLQKQSQVDENLQKQSHVDENLQKQSHEIETLLENFGSNEVNGIEEVVENFDTEDGKTESCRDSPASVRRSDDEKNSSIGRGSSRKDEDSFHKRKFVSKYEGQAQSPSKQAIVVSLCLHPALVQLLLHVPVSDFLITYLFALQSVVTVKWQSKGGTVQPVNPFNPEKDSENLHKAIKRFGKFLRQLENGVSVESDSEQGFDNLERILQKQIFITISYWLTFRLLLNRLSFCVNLNQNPGLVRGGCTERCQEAHVDGRSSWIRAIFRR